MNFSLSFGKCCECKSGADPRWERFYQDEKKARKRKLDIKYRLIKLPEQRELREPINWWHFVDRRCIDILSHGLKCTTVGGGDKIIRIALTVPRANTTLKLSNFRFVYCLFFSVNIFREDALSG